MNIRTRTRRSTLVWALAAGVLMALIGLFAFDGLPSASAQTDTTAPTVSSVAITSDPDNGVYGIGDDIELAVTFSEDVTVTGIPQLELDIGGTSKIAGYDSTDGSAVVFSYTVEEGDSDDEGIATSANKLTLNGGSIKDAADNAADLSHDALAAQESHRVDGIRPTVSKVFLLALICLSTVSNDSCDEVYTSGEILKPSAVFSEGIVVTGTPQLELNLEGTGKSADFEEVFQVLPCLNDPYCAFAGSVLGNQIIFHYSVAQEDSDADGVGIDANAISLNGGTIKDAAGNDAVLTHSAVAESSSHLVDGDRDIGGL